MKTEKFVEVLSQIDERYVQALLEEQESPALPAEEESSHVLPDAGEQPKIRMQKPSQEKAGLRIFRYLILTASAAACLFGISRLMLLDRHSGQNDFVEDTVPTEAVTTMAEAASQTTGTSAVTQLHPAVITSGTQTVTGTSSTAAQTVSAEETQSAGTAAAGTESVTAPPQTTAAFEDGSFDSISFAMRRQPPAGESKKGGTLVIGVVDMMTGEPIPGVKVELLSSSNEEILYHHVWTSETDRSACFTGMPVSEQYFLSCLNLPEGYGDANGNWEQQMQLSFDGKTEMTVNARLIRNDINHNIQVNMFDWSGRRETGTNGVLIYGNIRVTAKDGTTYYGNTPVNNFSLPDGEYHVDAIMHPEPMELLKPDSAFGRYLKELYPELDLPDQSGGIDFTVRDGIPDKDLTFNIAPPDDKCNSITVSCTDPETGEPVKGAVISVIEAPEVYAKKIAEWTSDETGTHTFDGLMFCGDQDNAQYLVKVEQVPKGYTGGYDTPVTYGFIYGYQKEIRYYFYKTE